MATKNTFLPHRIFSVKMPPFSCSESFNLTFFFRSFLYESHLSIIKYTSIIPIPQTYLHRRLFYSTYLYFRFLYFFPSCSCVLNEKKKRFSSLFFSMNLYRRNAHCRAQQSPPSNQTSINLAALQGLSTAGFGFLLRLLPSYSRVYFRV